MDKKRNMKHTNIKRCNLNILLSVSLLAFVAFGGCITSQPSKFYILTPINHDSEGNISATAKTEISNKIGISDRAALQNITLGLGPVSIAKYLDRSQLVVRLSPNQIKLEDFHQWAGSPRDDIPAVLLENLSTILGTDTIYKYPWKSYVEIDYQIVVEINQLDGRPGESVRLVARWEILKGNALQSVKGGKNDFTEQISGSGSEDVSVNQFDAFVLAQSRALGKLSEVIARSLIELL